MIEAAVWMARWRLGRSKMTGTQVHCRSLHGRSAQRQIVASGTATDQFNTYGP